MKKLLTTTDKIKIALTWGGEIANHLLGANGSLDWYYRPWSIFNVSRSAFQTAISRQISTGEIIKIIDPNKGVVYRMSPKGEMNIYRDYPLAKLAKQPWDGLWRMVIYDLPVKLNYKRDRLRSKLVELGFGCYQKSVYVTPLDVLAELKEYAENQGLIDSVVVFEGSRIFGEKTRILADRLWNLALINEEYFELGVKLDLFVRNGKPKERYKEIWDDFTKIILKDPLLPDDFLPNNWVGEKIKARMFGK